MGINLFYFQPPLYLLNEDKMASFFCEIVEETCREFKQNTVKAFKDKNTISVNINDPPLKKYVSYPVHRAIYAKSFAANMLQEEKVTSSKHCVWHQITTLHRMVETFGLSPLISFNKYNDVALAMPQFVISVENGFLKRGDIVFPLSKVDDQTLTVFVPGGHDDAHTEKIPLGRILGKDLNEEDILPICSEEGYAVTVKKGDNWVSIKSGSSISTGDYLVIRGKRYEVIAISDDAFTKTEGDRDILRTRKSFENNSNRQKLRFVKSINLVGQICTVDVAHTHKYRPVDLKFLENKNGNNHGNAEISFHNAIFNQIGYIAHDRAVCLDDQ